jgi:hypothetical protein
MYERVATSPSCDMIVGDVQVGQIWKCPSLLFFELQQFEQYKTAKSYASKLLVWNRAPHGIHASWDQAVLPGHLGRATTL